MHGKAIIVLCILHLCNDPSGKQHRKKLHQPSVSLVTETGYRFSEMGHERLNRRPVIVGAGPCGLLQPGS